ncbi:MAG: hypothetical protein M5U14_01455 [Acidimicrobiia bacterium]|nr:hypothetical protein [Acidimicrobiia bacterium]
MRGETLVCAQPAEPRGRDLTDPHSSTAGLGVNVPLASVTPTMSPCAFASGQDPTPAVSITNSPPSPPT